MHINSIYIYIYIEYYIKITMQITMNKYISNITAWDGVKHVFVFKYTDLD